MERYSRNISVIGEEGQRHLLAGNVLIIGCGALGGHVAMLLAGAGVGHIGICDFDIVNINNLQRQLYFAESDAGYAKADMLKARMQGLNSNVEVTTYKTRIDKGLALDLFHKYDFIIDATDNRESKLMIEECARLCGKPCCIGGVAGWRGQVTTIIDNSAGMLAFFPSITTDEGLTPVAVEGVLGVLPSMIASTQAAEALKYLTGQGNLLTNRMLMIDVSIPLYQIIKFD